MNDPRLKSMLQAQSDDVELTGYQPLPGDVALDAALAAEGSPWLNDYVEFSSYWSPRSYGGYHEACGLWLLSTIAARRVSFYFGARRYTNLYLALVGRAGFQAKSSAIHIAEAVLQHLHLSGLYINEFVPDTILDWLYPGGQFRHDGGCDRDRVETDAQVYAGFASRLGCIYEPFSEDLRALAGFDEPRQAAGQTMLRQLEESPAVYQWVTEEGEWLEIKQPYLAILAEFRPYGLQLVARPGAAMWQNGFLARFCLATVPINDDIPRACFPDGSRVIPDSLSDPLRRWHERLGLPVVEMNPPDQDGYCTVTLISPPPVTDYTLDDDTIEAVNAYDQSLACMVAQLPNEDLRPAYVMIPERALRVAVLLASVAGEESVQLKHWARAQQIAEAWRISLHRLYSQMRLVY